MPRPGQRAPRAVKGVGIAGEQIGIGAHPRCLISAFSASISADQRSTSRCARLASRAGPVGLYYLGLASGLGRGRGPAGPAPAVAAGAACRCSRLRIPAAGRRPSKAMTLVTSRSRKSRSWLTRSTVPANSARISCSRSSGLDVEVVGRLVEHQQVGAPELGEQQPVALAAGEPTGTSCCSAGTGSRAGSRRRAGRSRTVTVSPLGGTQGLVPCARDRARRGLIDARIDVGVSRITPASGATRRPGRSSVVLPLPFGPTMPMRSPRDDAGREIPHDRGRRSAWRSPRRRSAWASARRTR